jgi:hypothetical protein
VAYVEAWALTRIRTKSVVAMVALNGLSLEQLQPTATVLTRA